MPYYALSSWRRKSESMQVDNYSHGDQGVLIHDWGRRQRKRLGGSWTCSWHSNLENREVCCSELA